MKCCDIELNFSIVGGSSIKIERAECVTCKTKYDRKQGYDVIYKSASDDFICNECGTKVLANIVNHTIYDDRFPNELAGSGRVKQEAVPYCPKCEKEPK